MTRVDLTEKGPQPLRQPCGWGSLCTDGAQAGAGAACASLQLWAQSAWPALGGPRPGWTAMAAFLPRPRRTEAAAGVFSYGHLSC